MHTEPHLNRPSSPLVLALAVLAAAAISGVTLRPGRAPAPQSASRPVGEAIGPPSGVLQTPIGGIEPSAAASNEGPIVGAAGMVVRIDPETGRPGLPDAAFRARALSPAFDRSEEGLEVVTRPDGSKKVDLRGRFHEYVVVRIAPDGSKVQQCVEGPDVDGALKGTGTDPAALEVR